MSGRNEPFRSSKWTLTIKEETTIACSKIHKSIIEHQPSTERSRGSTLVEFAVVASLFFALVFGVIGCAYLLYAQLTLQSAVAEGARFGITGRRLADPERPAQLLSRAESIRAVVERFASGIDRSQLDVRIEQLDEDGQPIPIEPIDLDGDRETLVVEARYPYPLLHLFLSDQLSWPLSAKAVMRNERFARLGR